VVTTVWTPEPVPATELVDIVALPTAIVGTPTNISQWDGAWPVAIVQQDPADPTRPPTLGTTPVRGATTAGGQPNWTNKTFAADGNPATDSRHDVTGQQQLAVAGYGFVDADIPVAAQVAGITLTPIGEGSGNKDVDIGLIQSGSGFPRSPDSAWKLGVLLPTPLGGTPFVVGGANDLWLPGVAWSRLTMFNAAMGVLFQPAQDDAAGFNLRAIYEVDMKFHYSGNALFQTNHLTGAIQSVITFSLPTPPSRLPDSKATFVFSVLIMAANGAPASTFKLKVLQSGVTTGIESSQTAATAPSTLLSLTMPASALNDPTGAGIELEVTLDGTGNTGNPNSPDLLGVRAVQMAFSSGSGIWRDENP